MWAASAATIRCRPIRNSSSGPRSWRPAQRRGLVPLALWTDPQRVDDRTGRFRPVGRGAGQHNGADIRPRPCRQPGLRKRARSRAVQGCRKPRYGGRVPRIRRWVGYLPLQRAIGDPVWKRGPYCAGTAFLCFAAAMPSGRSAESPQGSCIIPADFPQDARIPRKPLCRRCFPCRRCRWCFWCCRACAISPPPADFAGTGRFSGGQ